MRYYLLRFNQIKDMTAQIAFVYSPEIEGNQFADEPPGDFISRGLGYRDNPHVLTFHETLPQFAEFLQAHGTTPPVHVVTRDVLTDKQNVQNDPNSIRALYNGLSLQHPHLTIFSTYDGLHQEYRSSMPSGTTIVNPGYQLIPWSLWVGDMLKNNRFTPFSQFINDHSIPPYILSPITFQAEKLTALQATVLALVFENGIEGFSYLPPHEFAQEILDLRRGPLQLDERLLKELFPIPLPGLETK